jgi:hypothetical protein
MAVTALVYGGFLQSLANKEIDLDTDVLKVMLCTSTYTPNQDTHRYKSSVTNEVTGTGYTATGAALGSVVVSYTGATNVLMLDAADARVDHGDPHGAVRGGLRLLAGDGRDAAADRVRRLRRGRDGDGGRLHDPVRPGGDPHDHCSLMTV